VEHSLLHALQLVGLTVAGGSLWWRWIGPAIAHGSEGEGRRATAGFWGRWAAWLAATATFLDLFVQVAELEGRTVLGGVPLQLVLDFSTGTNVGQLAVARVFTLVLLGFAFFLSTAAGALIQLGLYLLAAALQASVTHAAAQPTGTALAVGIHFVHLVALSAWIGTVLQLWLQRPFLMEAFAGDNAAAWAGALRRFSPVALTAAAFVFVSGTIAAVRFVPSIYDLLFSAYGLTLILKLVLVAVILAAGAFNFLVAVPKMEEAARTHSHGAWRTASRDFLRALEIEATAGVLAIAVAGIVASVSPPGTEGAVSLTREQVAALITPKLPSASFVDPTLFVGDVERNRFDLLYSEFMHNWSGVGVIVMGVFWLVQATATRAAGWATRLWPYVFVPFAVFISAFADPEVFVLRQVGFWEAVSDPVVLEHQIGALLVLWLVWLGRRDSRRPTEQRPLGPTLPLLMIGGSLLLLGHAHASVRATQELTNLINVQHAVLGILGLLAGTIRWFLLRGLLPARYFRFAWGALIVLLGAFMAFFYREVV
jgi:putative copper export protein